MSRPDGRARIQALPPRTQRFRRRRLEPRPTQYDYLCLRYLVQALRAAIENVSPPPRDILDIYCGTRPYDELLPADARCIGLDINDDHGVADIVTDEFLPLPERSFDLVMSTEAFYYVPDPVRGVAEIRRVLRPGGTVIVSVPFVWEYDPTILEHRYTGPELAQLFAGWDDVEVRENGGRAVTWEMVTGRMVSLIEERLTGPGALLARPAFAAAYLMVNAIAVGLDAVERRFGVHAKTLPMNVMVTARRPLEG